MGDGNEWYHITLSHASFGIEIENTICITAAPIAKWMVGKSYGDIEEWVHSKGGTIFLMETGD
jgi:hypothetical protein